VTILLAGLVLLPLALGADAARRSLARITSLQNQVETRPAGAAAWSPSALNQDLAASDRVRTGPASRAAILYSDQTLHRLNEKSEVEIVSPSGDKPGLLRILSGQHYFTSRTPKDYGTIETPTVTAAIKGTEFSVDVGADSSTTITMLEGVVLASNSQGSLEVRKGEQAYVEPGKAPVRRVLVRPRDAVAWALYYPQVLGGSDAARLESMGSEGQSLSRAAAMLSSGQADAAKPLIEEALKSRPNDPTALALASVMEIAADRKEEAARLADKAVEADPKSPAAALAASFAAQASFDIPKARVMAEKAAQLDPQSSAALARAAELRMAEGDLDGARKAAEEAVKRTPDDARALTVLGFVELAGFHSAEAEKLFERAVASDSGYSTAHLGLGIARIRRGKVAEGREELQTATILDPSDSLLRSYLGKAYYEERRSMEASKELAAAKELDPSDPTPYLYDAILKQNDNRPVEALQDLRESVERNDRRAVYRSRLLLDQDTAVRASDLARIYNDLGFEQLGLVTARRSADEDQANYSSHLFLSGNYRRAPDLAPAFLSEILQARIYQPVSVNAARPDVVNQTVSFNEYTALFDRPRARAFGGLVLYGRTDTNLYSLEPSNPGVLDFVTLDSSRFWSGDLTGTLNGDRYAGAVGFSRLDDQGFRLNNDQTQENYHGFLEYALTEKDSLQVNYLYGHRDSGDLPLRQSPVEEVPERFDTHERNLGIGYHRVLSAKSDLAVSAIYNDTEQSGGFIGLEPSTIKLKGPQLEVQDVYRTKSVSWIFGAGGFDGTVEPDSSSGVPNGDDTFANGYAYAKIRILSPLEITAGVAVEHVNSPTGMLPPRDTFPPTVADLQFTDTKTSPKLGVSYYLRSHTTLRAAGYYRLSPFLGRLQTLEPTQVAGFNQFFEEAGGTWSKSYGGGVDQEFGSHLFGGLSYIRRHLDIPEASCDDPTTGCLGQPVTNIASKTSRNDIGSAYLNAPLGKRVAAGVEYSLQKQDFDTTRVWIGRGFENDLKTVRYRPQVRVFLPSGFFAGVIGTHYDQEAHWTDDLTLPGQFTETSRFWVADVQAGYRFPKRYGSVILEGRNITDREFSFYDRAVQDDVIPARTVSLRVNLTF
jgi:Flp pilus assembly protein TadD